MSADNYVVVRKFGDGDFRWAMYFASDDDCIEKKDEDFCHGPFATPNKAAADAWDRLTVIEYGIDFEDDCLCCNCKECKGE